MLVKPPYQRVFYVSARSIIGVGILLIYGIFLLGQGWIAHAFGLFIGLNPFTLNLVYIVLLVMLFGCLVGLIPGIRMYRYSLIDGMTVRI